MRMEIRAGEGGTDAEQFVSELSAAISKHSGISGNYVGSTVIFDRL